MDIDCPRGLFKDFLIIFFTQGPAWITSRVDGILYIVAKTASPQLYSVLSDKIVKLI